MVGGKEDNFSNPDVAEVGMDLYLRTFMDIVVQVSLKTKTETIVGVPKAD